MLPDLRKNHDLVITRPDKGRATVIMTRDDYVEKMLSILRDSGKFLALGPIPQFDQTAKIEQTLHDYLKELVESGDISEAIFRNIVLVGSTRPQM